MQESLKMLLKWLVYIKHNIYSTINRHAACENNNHGIQTNNDAVNSF